MRHPPVAATGLCYGRLDVPIADPACVPALAAQLRALGGTIWTSPAQRCRLVAMAVGVHQVDAQLQELDFGAWEGQRWDEIARPLLDAWAADLWGFSAPGGETGAALVARVEAFYQALPKDGLHVVISHGGPLRVLTALARGLPVDLAAPAQPPATILPAN